MQEALKHQGKIAEKIRGRGAVLMLDFDGTLSPFSDHPADAALSPATRQAVRAAASMMPTAIISGRMLSDIKRRVGIHGIAYAGSHGREWEVRGKRHEAPVSRRAETALRAARAALQAIADGYPALIRERKAHSIAFCDRPLTPSERRAWRRKALRASKPFLGEHLRLLDADHTIEIAAGPEWTKGECALLLWEKLGKNRLPVYIGDSLTDEDAFRALTDGITIRIGRKKSSAARYVLRRRSDIDELLSALTSAAARRAGAPSALLRRGGSKRR